MNIDAAIRQNPKHVQTAIETQESAGFSWRCNPHITDPFFQKNVTTDMSFDFWTLNQRVYLVQPFWDGNVCVCYAQVLTSAQ